MEPPCPPLRILELCSAVQPRFSARGGLWYMQDGVKPASRLLRMLEQAIPAANGQTQEVHTCPTVALAYCAVQLAYSIPKVDEALLQRGAQPRLVTHVLHSCSGRAVAHNHTCQPGDCAVLTTGALSTSSCPSQQAALLQVQILSTLLHRRPCSQIRPFQPHPRCPPIAPHFVPSCPVQHHPTPSTTTPSPPSRL
jgi:hypothetical protein